MVLCLTLLKKFLQVLSPSPHPIDLPPPSHPRGSARLHPVRKSRCSGPNYSRYFRGDQCLPPSYKDGVSLELCEKEQPKTGQTCDPSLFKPHVSIPPWDLPSQAYRAACFREASVTALLYSAPIGVRMLMHAGRRQAA